MRAKPNKILFCFKSFLAFFFFMKPVGSCLSDPSPFTCWLFHCHYVWINDVFGNQKTDPIGCNVTVWKCSSVLQPAHFLWLTLRYPLHSACSYSPHTPSTQILTFTLIWWIYSHASWVWGVCRGVGRELLLAEQWLCSWLWEPSLVLHNPFWNKAGYVFRGGALLSGEASIIASIITWLAAARKQKKQGYSYLSFSGTDSAKGFSHLSALKWTSLPPFHHLDY